MTKEENKFVEREGIVDFREIVEIQDAFLTLTNYADKIFKYLDSGKEKIFADKIRLANFGNNVYRLLTEFESDREATAIHSILELDPEEVLKQKTPLKKTLNFLWIKKLTFCLMCPKCNQPSGCYSINELFINQKNGEECGNCGAVIPIVEANVQYAIK